MAEPVVPDSLQQAPSAEGTVSEQVPQEEDTVVAVAPVTQPEGKLLQGRKRSLLEIHESSKDESRDPSLKPERQKPSTTDIQSSKLRKISTPGATPRKGQPHEAPKLSALKLEAIREYMKKNFDVDYDFSQWTCQISFRQTSDGGPQRQYDPYWYSPEGTKFRSQPEIARHLGYTPEQKVKKEPVKKEAVKKDVAKKDAAKKDAAKKDAAKKDAAKKDATKKDATKKDVVKKRAVKKETAEEDVAKKRAVKKHMTGGGVVRKQVLTKHLAEGDAAHKVSVAKLLAEGDMARKKVPKKHFAEGDVVKKKTVQKEALQGLMRRDGQGLVRRDGQGLIRRYGQPPPPGPPRPTVLKRTQVARVETPAKPKLERYKQAQLARSTALSGPVTTTPLKLGFGVHIRKLGVPVAIPGFHHATALYPLEHLTSWSDEEEKFTVLFSITAMMAAESDDAAAAAAQAIVPKFVAQNIAPKSAAHNISPKFSITATRGVVDVEKYDSVAEAIKSLGDDAVEVACSRISPDDACAKLFATQELANMLIEPGASASVTDDWEAAAVTATAQRALDTHAAGLQPEGVTELRLLTLMQQPRLRRMLRELPTCIIRWPRLLFGLSCIPVLKMFEGCNRVELCTQYQYVEGRGGWEEFERAMKLEQQIAEADMHRRQREKAAQRRKAPEPMPQHQKSSSVISRLECTVR